ncbi:hypothetical protein TanjilG_32289 [Lupinus angustifolius]|uniref:Uncharacterized protein n=1 Tax=Lupinus angustifolius TaxID=3871 RepID=A0A4P1R0J5_LUPAN|nr:hypothetical protein TanjilG_32289 [Lupinus angustifolius]
MAKLQMARIMTEVAPPRFISVKRHRMKKMLDTIAEEENDLDAANKCLSSKKCGSSSIGLPERTVLVKNF